MKITSRAQIIYFIIGLTSLSVALSVGALALFCFVTAAKVISAAEGYFISVLIPLLVAPPTAYLFGRFAYQLDLVQQELLFLSRMDELTGLFNRRTFIAEAQHRLHQAQIDNTPVAFLLLDADHFKNVNDTYGHAAGDEALRQISRVIRHFTHASAVVGRLGGEEFAIMVPGMNESEAVQLAEEVRSDIQAIRCRYEGAVFTLSVSIGIVVMPAAQTLKQLMKAADVTLYAAKTAGRNCCKMTTAPVL